MASKQNPYGVTPHNESMKDSNKKQFAPIKNNGHAIAALILGILSFFLSIITALPGIVIGHIALSKIKRQPELYEGKGMAITGLVLSYLLFILGLLIIGGIIYMYMYVPGFKEEFSREFYQGLHQGY